MAFGRLKIDQIETSTQIVNVDDLTASNGVSDGNKGDITVASGGTVWLVNNGAVSYNELADLPSFTGPVVAGRESGTGALQGLSLGNGLSISGGTLSVTVSGGGTGSVTSVGLVAPSGFAVAGSPITSSGNITLSFAAGYSLPTTASQANWDTAYSERLYWDGGATGLNAVTARTSLGLGNSATLNVGTTAGTVAAGDALSVHVAAADPHPNYALESSLATVATTGSYADLTNRPVIPSGADATPQPLGIAAIGVSSDYAREDHAHAMPSAADVGADPAGTSASGITAHEAAADPHPGYALESSLGDAALLNVGTASGTVAAGDDIRFTTDLSYTASTRLLASSTGADATLPLFTSTDAGLVPGSSGGTANFLRADGTWASPPAGSGGITDGDKGDITVSDSGATWLIDAGVVDTSNLGGDITAAGKALLDDADAAAQRTTLGLAAVASTGAYGDLSGTPSIPAAADAAPQPLGTAAIGISTDYAREDHVHDMPSAADVGADPAGTAASGISAHEAASDPHPGYALENSLATVATTGSYTDLSNTPNFTGPIVAGRASGTGALEGLTLGSGLSIVGSQLTVSSSGTGTVTSIGLVAPSGFVVSGSPITSAGDITLSFASGYSLPTTASQANWDTAYSERLYWDGGPTGLNAASGRTSLGLAAVASTGAYGDLTGTPVIPSGADATPQPLGVAAVGISTDYAREDHIHAMPSAGDVGADPAGTAASGISTHEAAADPHPNYALESSLGGAALLNVGTTSGTVAAGDDNRFVPSGGTTGQYLRKTSGTDYDAAWQTLTVSDVFVIACSDETSNLTAGTDKARFTMPYAGTLTAVKADVNTAPTGSTLVVDINEAGVSVLSTKLSIDAGETSSSTAATPAVISDSALANGAVISIDIDQIGSTVAGTGLKVTLYVTRS